jgi:hypothetical protein
VFGINWKGKLFAIAAALCQVIKALWPEHGGAIQGTFDAASGALDNLSVAFGGLSLYGIQEAVGKVSLKGKLGSVLAAVGGLVKVLLPNLGPQVDTILNLLITIGGGFGAFSLRSAIRR